MFLSVDFPLSVSNALCRVRMRRVPMNRCSWVSDSASAMCGPDRTDTSTSLQTTRKVALCAWNRPQSTQTREEEYGTKESERFSAGALVSRRRLQSRLHLTARVLRTREQVRHRRPDRRGTVRSDELQLRFWTANSHRRRTGQIRIRH